MDGLLANKKTQHHVWQFYLLPWTSNDTLFCLRNGCVDLRHPKKVAAQNYFYHAEELSQVELAFIEEFAISIAAPPLKTLHRSWLKTHNFPFQLLNRLKDKGVDEGKLNEVRKMIENNLYEELHTVIEHSAIPHLKALKNQDASFYESEKERINFLCFLNVQYFRTNKTRSGVLKSAGKTLKDRLGLDFEKLWNPLNQIFSTNVAWNMNTEGYKLFLLVNKSSIPFITGDQPVVNTFATDPNPTEPPKDLELYYPVSPKIAVLVTSKGNGWTEKEITVGDAVVGHYNNLIFNNFKDELYGNDQEYLTRFIRKASA